MGALVALTGCAVTDYSPSTGNAAGAGGRFLRKGNGYGVIVFVPGFRGDPDETWLNPSTGASWPELVANDADFKRYAIFVASYPSLLTTIEESVANVEEQLRGASVFERYSEVIFVAHSMGGLITKRLLINRNTPPRQRELARVGTVILLATPSLGSPFAERAAWLALYPQLRAMTSANLSDYLQNVETQWTNLMRERTSASRVRVFCAYETVPTPFGIVVSRVNARTECDEFIGLPFDHSGIAKPVSALQDPYLWAKRRITGSRLVIPTLSSAATSTTAPRLFSDVASDFVFVGRVAGRVDDFVQTPIVVTNVSSTTATDVTFDLWYYDGTRVVSFNRDWFIPQHQEIPRMLLLKGETAWIAEFNPSVPPNAAEKYKGGVPFAVKVLLSWKDAAGQSYRYIGLSRLVYAPPHENFSGAFRFERVYGVSSLDDNTMVEERWGPLKITELE